MRKHLPPFIRSPDLDDAVRCDASGVCEVCKDAMLTAKTRKREKILSAFAS